MRILFAGDFHTHHSEGVSFGNALTELINLCDYSAINYESPVECDIKLKLPRKSGPRLRQPKKNLFWLKNKGFNCLMLANNHIYDYRINPFIILSRLQISRTINYRLFGIL